MNPTAPETARFNEDEWKDYYVNSENKTSNIRLVLIIDDVD